MSENEQVDASVHRTTQVMCAQVKKKLNAREALTGKYLEFALGLVPDRRGDQYDKNWDNMERQLKAGEPLGDYEQHLMVDVFLLHVRLQAAHAESQEEGAG